jgi:hypothetical protein
MGSKVSFERVYQPTLIVGYGPHYTYAHFVQWWATKARFVRSSQRVPLVFCGDHLMDRQQAAVNLIAAICYW